MAGPGTTYDTYLGIASIPDATEIVVCTLSGVESSYESQTAKLRAWVALVLDTSVAAVEMKIRRGGLAGTQIGPTIRWDPGAPLVASTSLAVDADLEDDLLGPVSDTYVITLTLPGSSDTSSVVAVHLGARVN